MFRRWRIAGLMAAAIVLAAVALASASTSSVRTFYLNVKVGQCALPFSSKTITVVPCSNPRHVMEFYAVAHAGWGHQAMPPPAFAYAKARAICLADLRHVTHHALPKNRAWWAFWPDAGQEQARYGDKLICGFRTWPKLSPLGRGWHVR